MRKINLKDEHTSIVLGKLTPSFQECYSEKFIADAQVKQSKARNALFGSIINAKFIVLKKDKDLPKPPLYAIIDIYNKKSAQNLAGLIIYRLGNAGVINTPTPYISE